MSWRNSLAVLVVVLAACGGQSPTTDNAQTPVAASSAPSAAAVASASFNTPTPNSSSAPVPFTWAEVWREDWSSAFATGWIRDTVEGLECSDAPGSFVPGWPSSSWYGDLSGLPNLVTHVSWFTVNNATFPVDLRTRLTGVVDLKPDDRSWVGLTLIHASNSYAEVALNWEGGRLFVERYSGCDWEVLAEVAQGPHSIGVEHFAGSCSFYLNGSVLKTTSCSLRGDPRVGIYATNFAGGPVRAAFGTLVVEQVKD